MKSFGKDMAKKAGKKAQEVKETVQDPLFKAKVAMTAVKAVEKTKKAAQDSYDATKKFGVTLNLPNLRKISRHRSTGMN